MSKNQIDLENALSRLNLDINELGTTVLDYLKNDEKIDFYNESFDSSLSSNLTSILNLLITIHDGNVMFCVDDVLPRYAIVKDGDLFKCWGIIYWLSVPKDYKINKSGEDPFYSEFRINKEEVELVTVCCGDSKLLDVGKMSNLYDLEFDWIYQFDNSDRLPSVNADL